MPRILPLAALLLVLGCGSGPEAGLDKAKSQLASGAYDDAAATATAALSEAEGTTAWRLELVALEAEARGGKTDAARDRIERLAGAWPEQVKGSLYVQTASQLRDAGDGSGAISVLDAAAKRFPDDAEVTKAIEQAKTSGDASELEVLRSLGYLE